MLVYRHNESSAVAPMKKIYMWKYMHEYIRGFTCMAITFYIS